MDWITRRKLDNIWGPIGTLIVHVLVVFFFAQLMFSGPRPDTIEIEVIIREIETFEELDDIEQELDQLDDIPTVVDAVAPPDVTVDAEPPPVDVVSPSAVAEVSMADLNMMEAVSPLQFRGLYASRTASGRGDALDKYAGGMGEHTERAVRRALDWLRDHQDEDGSWGPEYRAAMTGLALLAFLAHGDTTSSPEYGMAIRRGLQYLLSRQSGGWFIGGGRHHGGGGWPRLREQVRVYEHVIATYAIAEAYGLTQIPFLRFALEDATQIIIDGQHELGSWDYDYQRGPQANLDVSLSGWHIQALAAARSAGASNRGLGTALDAAIHGIKQGSDMENTGMFRYGTREPNRGPDASMTGIAVLALQLAGHALDAETRAGMESLRELEFQWAQPQQTTDSVLYRWPMYSWFYITQARFHQGGRTWVRWNEQFAPAAVAMQNPDGTWGPPPGSVEGRYGPVYHTAIMALMLQVYYRFLPTYQPIEVQREIRTIEEDLEGEEEIIIEFGHRAPVRGPLPAG